MPLRQVKCPNCGAPLKLDTDSADESTQCHACGKKLRITKPAADRQIAPPRPVPSSDNSSTGEPSVQQPPASPIDQLLPPPVLRSELPGDGKPLEATETAQTGHQPNNSLPGTPLDREPSFSISTDIPVAPLRSKRRLGLYAMFAIMSFVFVGIVVTVAVFSTGDQNRGINAHGHTDSLSSGNAKRSHDSLPADRDFRWIDAATKSARVDAIRVKIERVAIMPVRGRDAQQRIQSSGDTQYLHLFLKVTSERPEEVTYQSWYGNAFEENDSRTVAELSDDAQGKYPMMIFDDVESVQGHTKSARLSMRDSITDVIIFELPASFDVDKIESWKISLPLQALGQSDILRFEIPVSMLVPELHDFSSPLEGASLDDATEASSLEDRSDKN